jgi:hypothetical protein
MILRALSIALGAIAHNVIIYVRVGIANAGLPSKFLCAFLFE